ncbi:MAG: hypothetical protein WDA27_13555 [Actinomycetota bacterium]
MSWIEAVCPSCEAVECRSVDFGLWVCDDTSASFYSFVCPRCGANLQKHATDRIVELLIAEGIRPAFWHLPAEMREEHTGPPLTVDDVLDAIILLDRPDWFTELTRATR